MATKKSDKKEEPKPVQKLTKLTPEQEAMIPVVRDEWLKIGLSTEPMNQEEAKKGVIMAYEAAGLKPPTEFIFLGSPKAGATKAAELAPGTTVKDQVGRAICGNHDANWLAFYDFFERCGIEEAKRLNGLQKVAKNASWWWPFETVAIITDRPKILERDDRGRLHNENGPALGYRDDWNLYAVHGVRIPDDIITHPENITVERIRKEPNAEIKRIMREKYGEGRYLADIKAKLIDTDMVPTERGKEDSGEILRTLVEDDEGRRFLVGSDGSTERVYYMEVPNTVKTCSEAHQFISGIDEKNLVVES